MPQRRKGEKPGTYVKADFKENRASLEADHGRAEEDRLSEARAEKPSETNRE